jgi:hypothetical protein
MFSVLLFLFFFSFLGAGIGGWVGRRIYIFISSNGETIETFVAAEVLHPSVGRQRRAFFRGVRSFDCCFVML